METISDLTTDEQKEISEFSDQILGQIRAKDTGETGDILTDLILKVEGIEAESISNEESFFSKIPIIGSLVKSSKKFVAQYDTISLCRLKKLHMSFLNLDWVD